jgi:hypothetical protein
VSVAATDGVPDSGPDFHDFETLSGSGSDDDDSTSGLEPFVGLGTIDITINGQGGFVISGVSDSHVGVSNFSSSGWAQITYEYSPIPEPTTLVLVASGLGVLALRRRKK